MELKMNNLFKKITKALSSVGIIFALAMLGAIGGQGPKWLRRFIFPAIVTIYAYFLLHNFWVLTMYSMSGALSIGYGIPSFNGPNGTMDDEGSAIGAFFYKLFKSELWANVLTRGFVGILISATMLSVPILKGTWLSFLIGSVLIIGVWSAVSWRGFGSIPVKLFGKEYQVLNVDITCYGVTACGLITIIHGFIG
jgi:hypothetical protein